MASVCLEEHRTDQAKIAIKYRNLHDLHVLSHDIITVDRHWLRKPMILRVRQDDFASWTSTYLRLVQPATSPMKKTLPPTWADESHPAIQKVAASLVQVDIWNPYGTNGASVGKTVCMGLVINATAGFVIIPRSLCPSDLCTLSVIFGDSIECPAKMVYEHALNFVVIQYDSSLVDGPIQSATFSKRVLKALDKTIIYGLNRDDSVPCTVETTVMYVEPLTGNFEPSRFYQPINVDGIHLQIDYHCKNGILFDVNGDVEALWLPFLATEHTRYVGISASLFMPAIERLQQGLLPAECRMLDVEFAKVHKSAAHMFGISEGMTLLHIQHVLSLIHTKETIGDFPGREFIKVSNIACGHEQQTLAPGDIILKLAEKSLTQMSDLGEMFTSESLNMTVVRNRLQVDINVPTVTTSSWQCNRVVWFLGATFESPYYPVPLCALKLYSQIFLTDRRCGSPADMYGLPLHHFLTEVNGVVTKDFDSFIGEIKKLMENKYCQLTMVSLQGVPRSFSLMPNKYFKTVEARRSGRDFHNWQFQDL